MATHALAAVGATILTLGAAGADEAAVETATYLLLQTPAELPDLPPRPAPAARQERISPNGATHAPTLTDRAAARGAARNAELPHAAARVAELELRAPTLTMSEIPPSGPALDAAFLRGIGDLAPREALGGAIGGSEAGEAGAAPLVDSEVLGNPPRMLNRRLISEIMSERYPTRLMFRGVEGQVVVAFIIGVDGRAEMNHVEVLSATDREFIQAALDGLRRMRFRPAELDGRRVRVRVSLPLVWQLPGNG
ncbi:MAG TPA: energy transducer TonB [Longimicrobium sp.]|nr:energy transducer TonB [Longimicrobium sp.]